MRCINFTASQLQAVRTVLAQAVELDFRLHNWYPREPLGNDQTRSKEELSGFCDLTRVFFSSSRLEKLALTGFYQVRAVSLSDLI
ncbi:hypothetical protein BU23DRAFT_555780 [Bimuria novae-zelandiae CBS 107.79]|uniref:Uncharacterized protein n=1 Tax=Bimuria novae-zelandiae CBS 107.79 TaxID=1447943 RepID=A0A6A5V3B6_9PLEO|nr:hypothetical protein BU23DRAFT_555780 [Bimuria novae-zelandiae CBS 107.79]